ncbi:MAG: hypothetical protein RPU59_05285 [Candidatus Sedimenticola sp. (ex Thyasira tokunagai)]
MNKKILFVVIILLIMFRLFYSLQQNLIDNENEKNLYLVGLKFYTTGEWPYYGEIIESTKSQISGALLGLLVGLPLYILPHPYSPIIFLVLWMTLALSFFAWYISKKKFNIKPIFIWVWTLTIPYTMVYGIKLHIWSYALPYSIFFFYNTNRTSTTKDQTNFIGKLVFDDNGFFFALFNTVTFILGITYPVSDYCFLFC